VRLERQVQRWQEAGLIDATTAERIIAHERRASRPVLLLAIGGLGAFTISVGLISVIAANWGDIPRFVKLLALWGSSAPMPAGWCGPAADHTVGSQTHLPWAILRSRSRASHWLDKYTNWEASRTKHCCCGLW